MVTTSSAESRFDGLLEPHHERDLARGLSCLLLANDQSWLGNFSKDWTPK